MAAEAGGDVGAGIGTRLRAARERKGLTILQAAERIHSDPRVVEALEAEQFGSLGAAVYARGHLRHYAEVLGEPVAELLERYANATSTAPVKPDLTQIPRAQPEGNSGRLVVPTIVLLVLIAIIGVAGWVMSLQSQHPPQPEPVEEASVAHEPDEAGGVNKATAGAASTSAVRPASPSPAGAAQSPNNRSQPPVSTDKSSVPATAEASAAPAPPPKPKEGELTLKFNADSWAEVYDASGQRLFYDVGAASSSHTVKGLAPLRVVLGNASGVTLEFNGRPTAIPNSTLPDGSAQFLINAHGRAVPTKPAANGD